MPSGTPVLITPQLSLLGESQGSKSPSTPPTAQPTSNSVSVHLTIFGRPTTKKTKNQVAIVRGRPRVFPSKKWREWAHGARVEIYTKVPTFPLAQPLTCRAIFWRERNAGDAVGYYQALADFLETCLVCRRRQCGCPDNSPGIRLLADDKWIERWDGSRLMKDKDNPRIDVYLAGIA